MTERTARELSTVDRAASRLVSCNIISTCYLGTITATRRTAPQGSLREYMVHLLYTKWLNYYVCMSKTSPCTPMSVFYAVFFANRTQHHPLSAISEKNRVRNAHGGTGRRFRHAHIVIAPFVTENVPYTHATSRTLDAGPRVWGVAVARGRGRARLGHSECRTTTTNMKVETKYKRLLVWPLMIARTRHPSHARCGARRAHAPCRGPYHNNQQTACGTKVIINCLHARGVARMAAL